MYQTRSLSSLLPVNDLVHFSSAYVTAIYDNEGGSGVVMGSLEHTLWKTGATMKAKRENSIFNRHPQQFGVKDLSLRAGVSSLTETHDKIDHMPVTSKLVDGGNGEGVNALTSPLFFVGHFDDWRDGMEHYARAQLAEPAELPEGITAPIVGWNSWGVDQFDAALDEDLVNVRHGELREVQGRLTPALQQRAGQSAGLEQRE